MKPGTTRVHPRISLNAALLLRAYVLSPRFIPWGNFKWFRSWEPTVLLFQEWTRFKKVLHFFPQKTLEENVFCLSPFPSVVPSNTCHLHPHQLLVTSVIIKPAHWGTHLIYYSLLHTIALSLWKQRAGQADMPSWHKLSYCLWCDESRTRASWEWGLVESFSTVLQ